MGWSDPLGTKPSRIKIQAKQRKDNLGEQGVGPVRPVTTHTGHPPNPRGGVSKFYSRSGR
jgi:hypothetical protein